MTQIETLEAGYKRIMDYLKINMNLRLIETEDINHGRYRIAYCINDNGNENILITFKREPFYNFGDQFKSKGYSGVGDSVNARDMNYAYTKGVRWLYTIFPNGHIYRIHLDILFEKSEYWINKEGKELRSFSIHEYKRVNEGDEVK